MLSRLVLVSFLFSACLFAGRFDCVDIAERLVLTSTPRSHVALSPQTHRSEDPKIARAKFEAPGKERLVVEFPEDGIARLEFSGKGGLPADNAPIYQSPLIAKHSHEGATSLKVDGGRMETPDMKIEVDSNNLSVKLTDKRNGKTLMTMYPKDLKNDWKFFYLDLTGMDQPDVQGLGQIMRYAPSIDHGFKGQTFLAANNFGNGMHKFDSNAAPTTNQMPVAFFHNGEKQFGLFVDNTLKTEWKFNDSNHGEIGMWGDFPRMYLITGKDIPDVHQKFMKIQGLPELPPKDMLGWGLSKFGYANWMELFDDLRHLESSGMPLPKQVYLDLQWFGETFREGGNPRPSDFWPSKMGTLQWDRRNEAFPHPEETVKWLKDRGIEIIPIHESYVADNVSDFKYMFDKGYFVKNAGGRESLYLDPHNYFWKWKGGMMDWSNPEARKYWFDTRVLPLTKMGIHKFWLDLGDPEIYDASGKYAGSEGQGHNHGDNHNIYNNLWVKMITEGYDRHHINERPITVSRAMTIGPKGWNWSGDINGGPDSLNAHLRAVLDTSWAGQNFLGSDAGGFWQRWPDWRKGQLYTRWLAHSAWVDFPFRVHVYNLNYDQEYLPSKKGEFNSNKRILEERAAMEPYFYSLAWDAHLTGAPMRSSPSFYFQNDKNAQGKSEMVIGRKDLLLGVSTTIDEEKRNVFLPEGQRWVHYDTHESYEGGTTLYNVPTRRKDGTFAPPLYARAGAMFPRTEQERATIEKNKDYIPSKNNDFVLRVFPDSKKSSFKLFEDDGHSRDYQNGKVRTTNITQEQIGKTVYVNVDPSEGSYSGAPSERKHKIEIATTNLNVANVFINNHELSRCNNKEEFKNWNEGYFVDPDTKLVIVKTGPMKADWQKNFRINFR